MAEDYFLVFQGIEGESEDEKFKNSVQIHSWSFGANQPQSQYLGTGAGAGKVNIQDFHFDVPTSKASAPLFERTCNGEPVAKVEFIVRKAGKNQQPYLKYTFGTCW